MQAREEAAHPHAAPKEKAPEKAKLTDEEVAAGVAAYAVEPEKPDKAAKSKADKERETAAASERFVCNTHLSGGLAPGDIVDRKKFGKFTNDKGEPDEEAYKANLGRLIDLGAISPAPKEEEG